MTSPQPLRLRDSNVNRMVAHAALTAMSFQCAGVTEEALAKGFYPARLAVPMERHRAHLSALQRELHALLMLPYAKRWQPGTWARIQYLERAIADMPMTIVDEDVAVNLVPDVAARHAEDNWLAGSGYSVVGPYMFLVSAVSWTGVSNSDTMASHGGWTEAGATNAPTYTGTRKTMAWSAASSRTKSLSAALNFSFTGAGTVKGCGMALGAGAVNTIDNTSGTLGSVGQFTGGDKVIGASGDALAVSYSIAL